MIKKLNLPAPINNAANKLLSHMIKEKLVRMTFTTLYGVTMNITCKRPKEENTNE